VEITTATGGVPPGRFTQRKAHYTPSRREGLGGQSLIQNGRAKTAIDRRPEGAYYWFAKSAKMKNPAIEGRYDLHDY
jgi:hypothetical protein